MSPAFILFARLALGAAVLLPIVRRRGQRLPRSRPSWSHIFIAAAIANVIPYLFFAIAEQHVDSSLAGMLNATTPLWALTFALAAREARSSTQTTGRTARRTRRSHPCPVAVEEPRSALYRRNRPVPPGGGQLRPQLRLHGQIPHQPRVLLHSVLSASQLAAATLLATIALPWARIGDFHLRADALVSMPPSRAPSAPDSPDVLNYRLIADEGATTASLVTYLLPAVAILLAPPPSTNP